MAMIARPDRRLFIAAGALALALLVAWFYRSGGDASKTEAERGRPGGEAPVSVTTAKTRRADVPVTIDAVGTVQALNTVTIRTQVDGRLMRLAFTEGQDVKKGDLIAEIDPALYKAQYDQAVAKKAQDEANLANARLDLARYEKLVIGNFASKQQYATQKALVAQLEALVRADQASIENTRATLDYATIRSPVDGRTGIRLVDVGNILHANDQTGIVVISQLKPIYVVFTLPQQSLPAVRKAKSDGAARVAALAPDNASVLETGELSVIDNQIDQQTGTVRLKATFANADLGLWPGQFVNVRLTLDTIRQAVVAPSPAVQRGPSGAFVYVLGDDGLAHQRVVSTGRQDESQVVVTNGLEPGETVIVSGFTRLTDGTKTRVIDPTPAPDAGAPTLAPEQRRRERGARSDETRTR